MATEIAIGDIEIASLQIEDNAVHNNEFINQTIVARGLRVNTHTFDTVSISAIGDKDRHDLEIDLKSDYVGASLEASGALVDWQQLATMGWQGEITELQFEFSDDLTIALNSPVSVDVSGSEVLLEQSCLDIQDKEALCLRAHWIKATSVDLAAELHSVPLSTLMLLVDTDVELTQEISGQLSWSSAGSALTNALTNIEISPGRIVSTYDSRLSMDTGKGILDFQVIDGALGSGTFDLPIPGYGAVDIEFQVDDLSLGANSPLSGSALIDMSDINILAELFPFIDSDGGRLAANLSVSGTLSSPSVEGEVTLRDATFRYRPFGTTLSDLQIDAVILANNQVDLEGRFKAGEGTGTVVTSAAYEAGDIPDLEFEITGSNLLLIDDPEIRVIGDPDIRISIHDRALQLDGKIRIPEADVTPSVLPQAPISESDDVTIVAGDSPDDGRTAGDEQKFRINGSLEVEFGDNVNVDLDIATANLGGSVVFEWRDEFMPTATGTFMVDGTIAAVGQVLTVHEGAISFPGVPADNPHLNIAAERVIFGNTQVKTAGILLTGTAKKPIVEAYTYPLTTEERALALLATGSDFDYEQGVGALDFGVYIAPRIYLSYGIGVFDRDNIISARYDLKRGFGVRASSGRRESGIDVSYRVDK
jgi:translocation and assembly module TamB